MGGGCPNLLDLIPKRTQWVVNNKREDEEKHRQGCGGSDKSLELRLGLPGDGDGDGDDQKNPPVRERTRESNNSQLLSLNFSSSSSSSSSSSKLDTLEQKRVGFPSNPWLRQQQQHQNSASSYQTGPKGMMPTMPNESSKPCCSIMADLQTSEIKAFSHASANTAVHTTSQKRAAPAAVVGWPPVRSFRKNLASSSSSKLQSSIPSMPLNEKPGVENSNSNSNSNSNKGMFVKINMDGVPIGRKVDLNAYGNYEKLCSSVDSLFRDLLAAQSGEGGSEQKVMRGLIDGSGEYTLVYEDNEGDRLLLGDVPWPMFVSTVKRLRVLKTSDLPTLCRAESKKNKEKQVEIES